MPFITRRVCGRVVHLSANYMAWIANIIETSLLARQTTETKRQPLERGRHREPECLAGFAQLKGWGEGVDCIQEREIAR